MTILRQSFSSCGLACWLVSIAGASYSPGASLSLCEQEAENWIHHLVPLPKHVKFHGSVQVRNHQVVIRAEGGSGPLVDQAVQELAAALGSRREASSAETAAFAVTLQQGGPEADRLAHLPNADQAYRILPSAGGGGLRLVARSPVGLYYAAKTLQQLVKAKLADGLRFGLDPHLLKLHAELLPS